MHLLENNVTKFSTIASIDNIKDLFSLPLSSIGYVNLPFFTNWIVGFTIAEGSFHIKSSGEHFFSPVFPIPAGDWENKTTITRNTV